MFRIILLILALASLTGAAFANPSDFDLIGPTSGAEQVDVWPLFEWEAASDPGVVSYTLWVGTDNGFTPGTFTEYSDLSVTSFRPEVDLVMGTLYFWKVKAVNDLGEWTWCTAPGSPFGFWQLQTIMPELDREILGSLPLEANRTLIQENSPYTWKQGNLVVPTGVWLEVGAGVTIEVDSDYYLEVHGQLRMIGDPENVVTVTSGQEAPMPGDWKYIVFAPDAEPTQIDSSGEYVSGSVLRWIRLEYGGAVDHPLVYSSSAKVFVQGLFAGPSNNSPSAIEIGADGSVVRNCEIDGFVSTWHGPGIRMICDEAFIVENRVENCKSIDYKTVDSCFQYGGGLYLVGSDLQILGNVVVECEANSRSYYGHPDSRGGGIYVSGQRCRIEQNTIRDCLTNARREGVGTERSYGGGLFLEGSDNTLAHCTVLGCQVLTYNTHDYIEPYGGGVYINQSGNRVQNCTISNNYAKLDGGGIYVAGAENRINGSTITYNIAGGAGGGIRGAQVVFNSIVKNNESLAGLGGGIYTDADSLCNNNINSNFGYNLYVSSPDNVIATNNWWLSRSDEDEIEAGIHDGNDDEGATGQAIYQPFLPDVSETTPGRFTQVTGIQAYSDGTYSAPINLAPSSGDTLFFQITGVDDNEFNCDVTVAEIINWDNSQWVQPFFEETGPNTGIFNCWVVLGDQTVLPDQIMVNDGHNLTVRSKIDPDFNFNLIVYDGISPVEDLPTTAINLGNFPNPFNPQTTISFNLSSDQLLTLQVYDLAGRLVDVLLNDEVAPQGRNEVVWTGRDLQGRQLPSGTYFYRLEAGSFVETKRMTLLK